MYRRKDQFYFQTEMILTITMLIISGKVSDGMFQSRIEC